MASLRRTISQQIRDSRATTTVSGKADHSNPSMPAAASFAAASSQAQSPFLRAVALAMEGGAKGATKMSSWKKLLIQFGVCFVVGLLLGWFTPQKWQLYVPDSLAVEGKSAAEADLFGNSMVANALTETKTTASRDEVGNTFSGDYLHCPS